MDTIDWIALSIAVYLFVAALVAGHAFVLRKASVFEPIGQYLAFMTLFTLPLPIRACMTLEIEGDVTPHLLSILHYLPAAVLMAALSLPLFSFGYYSRWAQWAGSRLPVPVAAGARDRSRWSFVLLAVFSLALIYLLTEQAGGVMPFLLMGYRASEETFGRGYLAIGFPWLFVATLFLLYRYARLRRRKDLLFFAAALCLSAGMQLLQGNRSVLMYMGIVALIYVHFAVRRLRWYVLAPIAIAVFVALNVVGLLRGSDYESVADYYERSSTVAKGAGDSHEGIFYTLTIGEFVVPFETLPQMIRTVGVSDSPWFGWSYLRTPLYLVPSAVFPDRPLPLTNWYMGRFYGGGYTLNQGRAFFFLAEGYLNFMLAGVVLISIAWGFGWGVLHRWMVSNPANPAVLLLYALIVGFMFRCIAGDLSTVLIGIPQQSVVAALLGLFIAGVRWRAARRARPSPLAAHHPA